MVGLEPAIELATNWTLDGSDGELLFGEEILLGCAFGHRFEINDYI